MNGLTFAALVVLLLALGRAAFGWHRAVVERDRLRAKAQDVALHRLRQGRGALGWVGGMMNRRTHATE